MPAADPSRVSIRAASFPHRNGTGWTARRLIAAVLVSWGAVAALLAAVILVIVWDLRP
jgi:hypothetical protein